MDHIDLTIKNNGDLFKIREPLTMIFQKNPKAFDLEATGLHINLKAFPKSERLALVDAVTTALDPFDPARKTRKKETSFSKKKHVDDAVLKQGVIRD